MFRDPMASRKPQGILASSAPMMTAAQKAMAKNQPMKAQTGASVNTSPMGTTVPSGPALRDGTIRSISVFGKPQTYQFQGGTFYQLRPDGSLGSKAPPLVAKNLMNITSMGAPRSGIVTIPGGFDMSMTPYGPPQPNTQDPNYIANLISQSPTMSGLSTMQQRQQQAAEEQLLQIPSEKRVMAALMEPGQQKVGVTEDGEVVPMPIGDTPPKIRQRVKPRPGEEISPFDAIYMPDYGEPRLTAGEMLAATTAAPQEVITPDITDTAVEAGAEAQETAGESEAVKGTTGIDTSKLTQMLADHQAGESKVTPLNDQELFTPEAVEVAAMEIPKEATLSDIEEKYKELFDYDPKQLEGDKKDAFWRNLTMAGLAMAAGESDNALTNIAKGAMVGLDTYGKEVGELTKADREAKREDRRTKLQLIQNENDKNIAMAQLKNAYNMDKAKIDQSAQQFGVTSALQKRQLEIDEGYKRQQGEIALVTALNDANYKREALQVQRDQLSLEQFKSNVANSSELAQGLYPFGPEYATRDEEGNITVNPEFLRQMEADGTIDEYIDLLITGKEKSPTDTTLNAQAISEQLGISLAQARTLIALGGGRLKEGVPIADVMAEFNIVPDSAGGVNPTPDASTMATAAQQGLVWNPNATSTSGKQGAFVPAQQ